MSAENKAIIRRMFEEVWNGRNPALLDDIFAPNSVHHDAVNPDVGTGPKGQRSLYERYTSAFPDSHFTLDEVIAEGDLTVARWTVRGTHRGELTGIAPTGKQITVGGVSIARISRGKIVESWSNWDALGLMQQI